MVGRRKGSRHRDPLESKKVLLEYLTKNDDVSLTKAGFVMEKQNKHALRIMTEMEKEGLITVRRTEGLWVRAYASITPKGYEVYQMLLVMKITENLAIKVPN